MAALTRDENDSWEVDAGLTREAAAFLDAFIADSRTTLPPAVVIDVGRIVGKGWALVEANCVWGSGIYGCDPHEVLPVLRRSCVKPVLLTVDDQNWVVDHQSEDFT